MDKLNVAVLGAGFMGGMHARVFASHPLVDLTLIADARSETATAVASRYGARAAGSVEDIAQDDGIAACVVALPDTLHVDAACRLLEAGKAVLVEKPLAHTLADASRISATARSTGSRLLVGHLLHFDPRYARAADLVAAGEIGEPLEVRAVRLCAHPGQRARGSSTRFLVGIHDMDAIQWVIGSRVTEVFARSRVDTYPAYPYGIDDVVHCSLEFENGVVGTLVYGWTLPERSPWGLIAGMDITGTEGSLSLKPEDTSLLAVGSSGTLYQDSYYWPAIGASFEGDLGREVDHFVTSVLTGAPFRFGPEGPLAAVALSDAIESSLRSGSPAAVQPTG